MGTGSKLHGRKIKGLDALRAVELHGKLPELNQEILLSSSGPGVGKLWNNYPQSSNLFVPNQRFRIAVLSRLGLLRVPRGAVCQIAKSSTTDGVQNCCLEPLDEHAKHVHLCKAGPAWLHPPRGLANVLAAELRCTGAHTDLERACPQLLQTGENGTIQEAILDVVYHAPGGGFQRLIDVTIRCPHAQRYNPVSSVP